MDIAQTQLQQQCPKHPDYQIDFFQVDNLSNNKQGQKLFYCSICSFEDPQFKHSNYSLFREIIKSGNNQIFLNWPPVNDNQIIRQLIQISTGKEENQKMIAAIEQYFLELRRDIMIQIDICQKKMIQQAEMMPQNKNDILNKYQALSRVNELRSLLIDNKTDIDSKEQKYRVLLENILAKKQTITEELTSLLNQHQQKVIFNSESALEMKQSILNTISSINLFEQTIIQNQNTYINSTQQPKLDLQLFTTDFQNGKDYTTIRKNQNNQYQLLLKKQSNYMLNIVSNIILQNATKYIFRLQIKMINQNDKCDIGLMQNNNIHTQPGFYDYLCCVLYYKDNCILQHPYDNNNSGIGKVMKGKQLRLCKENSIEMRVCIKDEILEVLDYPNYTSKLVLVDQHKSNLINHKSNLINHKDLRLYLSMQNLKNSMILKEAFTVEKFE